MLGGICGLACFCTTVFLLYICASEGARSTWGSLLHPRIISCGEKLRIYLVNSCLDFPILASFSNFTFCIFVSLSWMLFFFRLSCVESSSSYPAGRMHSEAFHHCRGAAQIWWLGRESRLRTCNSDCDFRLVVAPAIVIVSRIRCTEGGRTSTAV